MVHTIKSNQMVDADEIGLSSTEGRRDSWFSCQKNIIMAYEKGPKLPNSAHAIWFRELPFSENGIRSVIGQGAWQRQIQRSGSRAGKDTVILQLPPIPMFLRRQHRRGQTINLRNIKGKGQHPSRDLKGHRAFPTNVELMRFFWVWAPKPLSCPQSNRGVTQPTPWG